MRPYTHRSLIEKSCKPGILWLHYTTTLVAIILAGGKVIRGLKWRYMGRLPAVDLSLTWVPGPVPTNHGLTQLLQSIPHVR